MMGTFYKCLSMACFAMSVFGNSLLSSTLEEKVDNPAPNATTKEQSSGTVQDNSLNQSVVTAVLTSNKSSKNEVFEVDTHKPLEDITLKVFDNDNLKDLDDDNLREVSDNTTTCKTCFDNPVDQINPDKASLNVTTLHSYMTVGDTQEITSDQVLNNITENKPDRNGTTHGTDQDEFIGHNLTHSEESRERNEQNIEDSAQEALHITNKGYENEVSDTKLNINLESNTVHNTKAHAAIENITHYILSAKPDDKPHSNRPHYAIDDLLHNNPSNETRQDISDSLTSNEHMKNNVTPDEPIATNQIVHSIQFEGPVTPLVFSSLPFLIQTPSKTFKATQSFSNTTLRNESDQTRTTTTPTFPHGGYNMFRFKQYGLDDKTRHPLDFSLDIKSPNKSSSGNTLHASENRTNESQFEREQPNRIVNIDKQIPGNSSMQYSENGGDDFKNGENYASWKDMFITLGTVHHKSLEDIDFNLRRDDNWTKPFIYYRQFDDPSVEDKGGWKRPSTPPPSESEPNMCISRCPKSLVSIEMEIENTSRLCTGILLVDNYVLTAGSCIPPNWRPWFASHPDKITVSPILPGESHRIRTLKVRYFNAEGRPWTELTSAVVLKVDTGPESKRVLPKLLGTGSNGEPLKMIGKGLGRERSANFERASFDPSRMYVDKEACYLYVFKEKKEGSDMRRKFSGKEYAYYYDQDYEAASDRKFDLIKIRLDNLVTKPNRTVLGMNSTNLVFSVYGKPFRYDTGVVYCDETFDSLLYGHLQQPLPTEPPKHKIRPSENPDSESNNQNASTTVTNPEQSGNTEPFGNPQQSGNTETPFGNPQQPGNEEELVRNLYHQSLGSAQIKSSLPPKSYITHAEAITLSQSASSDQDQELKYKPLFKNSMQKYSNLWRSDLTKQTSVNHLSNQQSEANEVKPESSTVRREHSNIEANDVKPESSTVRREHSNIEANDVKPESSTVRREHSNIEANDVKPESSTVRREHSNIEANDVKPEASTVRREHSNIEANDVKPESRTVRPEHSNMTPGNDTATLEPGNQEMQTPGARTEQEIAQAQTVHVFLDLFTMYYDLNRFINDFRPAMMYVHKNQEYWDVDEKEKQKSGSERTNIIVVTNLLTVMAILWNRVWV